MDWKHNENIPSAIIHDIGSIQGDDNRKKYNDDDKKEDYDDKEGPDKEGGRPLCVSLLPVSCSTALHCLLLYLYLNLYLYLYLNLYLYLY